MSRYQDMGHCKHCKFQWVIPDGARGKRLSSIGVDGRVCPFCKRNGIRYTKELKNDGESDSDD